MNFVCKPCRTAADSSAPPPLKKAMHEKCKGGTWCDCMHRPVKK